MAQEMALEEPAEGILGMPKSTAATSLLANLAAAGNLSENTVSIALDGPSASAIDFGAPKTDRMRSEEELMFVKTISRGSQWAAMLKAIGVGST